MKVNSINSIKYTSNIPSFKHTAVPYPEYEKLSVQDKQTGISAVINKLFHPVITKKSQDIKQEINGLYQQTVNNTENNKTLSVVA